MNLNETLSGVSKTKQCSIKADKDSRESKKITLVIDYSGLSIEQLLAKCVSHDVIAWQNGQGRKNYGKFQDGQTVSVKAAAPAATIVDPVAAFLAEASAKGFSPEQYLKIKQQELAELKAKSQK